MNPVFNFKLFRNTNSFEENLQSLTSRGIFKRYFSVSVEKGGPVLTKTHVIQAVIEKIAGMMGGQNLTDSTLVEAGLICFLEKNVKEIKTEDQLKKIKMISSQIKLLNKKSQHIELKAALKEINKSVQQIAKQNLGSGENSTPSTITKTQLFKFLISNQKKLVRFNDITKRWYQDIKKNAIPNTIQLHPRYHFSTPIYASNLFAAFHLDFTNLGLSEITLDPSITLPFIVQQLKALLQDKFLQKDQSKIKELIKTYEFSHLVACWQNELTHQPDALSSLAYKKAIKKKLLEQLGTEKKIVIPTGYSGSPGHAIALELTLMKKKGKMWVQGRVTNTGEGLEFHRSHWTGNKEKKDVNLTLLPIPLDDLEESSFLENLLDLSFTKFPTKKELPNTQTNTFYIIRDFYDGLLPLWPNKSVDEKFAYSTKSPELRTPQRGDTCSAKIFSLKEALGPDAGNYCKYHIKLKSLENYINTVPITLKNADSILDSIKKLNRIAIKLKKKKILDEQKLKELLTYSKEIRTKVKQVKEKAKNDITSKRIAFSEKDHSSYSKDFLAGVPCVPPSQEIPTHTKHEFYKDPLEISKFLTVSCESIKKLVQTKQVVDAIEYAKCALMALPSCDSLLWDNLATEDLEKLMDIQEILVSKPLKNEAKKTTPNESCIHLKCLAITLKATQKKLDPKLIAFMLRRVPSYFSSHLYGGPSSSLLASEANKAYALINTILKKDVKYKSKRYKNSVSGFDHEQYESLQKCKDNPEISFLIDRVKEKNLTDAELVAKAFEFLEPDSHLKTLTSCGLEPKINTQHVKEFALIKKQSFMMLHTFFVDGICTDDGTKLEPPYQLKVTLNPSPSTLFETEIEMNVLNYPVEKEIEDPIMLLHSQDVPILRHEVIEKFHRQLQADNDLQQNRTVGAKLKDVDLIIKEEKISLLEQQELLSIQCKKDLMIPQLIHFFDKYCHRLESYLFRGLFTGYLFKMNADTNPSAIQKCMQNSLMRKQLFDFLGRASQRAEKTKSFNSQCFLLKTHIQSLVFLSKAVKKDNFLLLREKNKVKEDIERLLNTKISPNERSALAYTLVGCYSYIRESEEIHSALSSFCEQAHREIHEKGYSHGFDKKDPSDLSVSCDQSYQFKEDYEKGSFDLKNDIGFDQTKSVLLPDLIVKNSVFQDIFGRTTYRAQKIVNNLYEFHDDSDHVFRAMIGEDSTIKLYFNRNGEWYENRGGIAEDFDSANFPDFSEIETNIVLQKSRESYWVKVGSKEMLVMGPGLKEIKFTITPDKILKGSDPNTLLANNYEDDPTIAHLSRLTEGGKNRVLMWKKPDGELTSCEIPSLKLSFRKEKTVDGQIKWMSNTHPGYYLDSQLDVWELQPLSHYVIIRNEEGQQKVIISDLQFDSKNKVQFPTPQLPKNQPKFSDRVISYSLNSNGSIKLPHEAHELLYLIHILLAKGDYRLALQAFKKLQQHPHDWNKKASLAYTQFFQSSWTFLVNSDPDDVSEINKHPHAIALRLKLLLLAHQSLKSEQSNGEEELYREKLLKSHYLDYLNQINNMESFTLDSEDELACMRFFKTFPNKILCRLQQIAPSTNKIGPMKNKELSNLHYIISGSKNFDWLTPEIQKEMVEHVNDPILLPTQMRLTSDFAYNFLFYYQVIHNQSFALDEVGEFLKGSRFTSDEKLQALGQFLICMMKNPKGYPSIEEMVKHATEGTLRQVLEKINQDEKTPKIESSIFSNWYFFGNIRSKSSLYYPKIEKESLLKATKPAKYKNLVEDSTVDPIRKILINDNCFKNIPPHEIEEEISKKEKKLLELETLYAQKKSAKNDPSVKSEYQRIWEGIQEKKIEIAELRKTLKKKTPQTIELSKLDQISLSLSKEIKDLDHELDQLKNSILAKANNTHSIQLQAEVEAGLITPLKFKEMMLHYGRQDDRPFLESNPSLSAQDLREIKMLMRKYLLARRHQQKCIRLNKSAQAIRKLLKLNKNEEVGSECREFMSLYDSQPCYSSGHPYLLVFEVMGDILVRKDQYQKLMEMTKDNLHAILEARTGFGKSKVLIPLWLYLTSKKKGRVSMMAVTASLLAQQVAHLKEVLGGTYYQSIFEVHLNREQGKDLKYLKRLNQRLENAIKKKMCVIADINTLHHMVDLAYKEHLAQENPNKEVEEELTKLRKIITKKLSLFIDESSECLSIRHKYDDALGQPISIDINHSQAVGMLYDTLILNDQEWAFEFLPETIGRNPISEREYEQKILPQFAQKVMSFFNVDKKFQKAILSDLQGQYSQECEGFYQILSPQQLKRYSICKGQLNLYLKRSLNRNVNDQYALSKKLAHLFAVPCLRGKPNESSEFSSLDDLLNFTIQANLKDDLQVKHVQEFFNGLKKDILKGVDKDDPRILLCDDLLNAMKFPDVTNVLELKTEHIKKIQLYLNDPVNRRTKLQYIVHAILPNITYYERKVTSSAYNILSIINSILGASGTVRSGILPTHIITLADKTAPIENLLSMMENSTDQVYEIPVAKSSKDKLLYLLKNFPQYQALIDVDGSFREMSPKEVAQAILEETKILAVSYYDHQGRNLVLMRGSEKPIPREECKIDLDNIFTYFPQSSVVGSDTLIYFLCKALVTVNKSTELDLFLQGVGRMRGLQKGQQVGFVINHSDAEIIKKSYPGILSFLNLLCYLTDNQGIQKGKDQFYALKLMLEDQIENFLRIKFPHQYKKFIQKETQVDPLSNLRKNKGFVLAKLAIEGLVEEMSNTLKSLLSAKEFASSKKERSEMESKFLKSVNYDLLPIKIALSQEEVGTSTVEVEATADNLAEQVGEQDQEQLNEQMLEQMGNRTIPIYTAAKEVSWDGNYEKLSKSVQTRNILDEKILISPNYFRISENGKEIGLRKASYQYLIIHDIKKNVFQLMLLDLHDAESVLKRMQSSKGSQENKQMNYYLYSGSDLIGKQSSQEIGSNDWKHNEQLMKLNIIRKIYSADPYLTKNEKDFLNKNKKVPWTANLKSEIKESTKIWPYMKLLNKAIA